MSLSCGRERNHQYALALDWRETWEAREAGEVWEAGEVGEAGEVWEADEVWEALSCDLPI